MKGRAAIIAARPAIFGRIGITEVLEVDDAIREMLILGKSSDHIKTYAQEKKGMTLLWDDIMTGFSKARPRSVRLCGSPHRIFNGKKGAMEGKNLSKEPIGEILLRRRLIKLEQLEQALRFRGAKN